MYNLGEQAYKEVKKREPGRRRGSELKTCFPPYLPQAVCTGLIYTQEADLFLFTALTNFRCAHPKYRLLEVDKGTYQLICTKAVGQAFLLETTVIQTETWKKIWQSLDKAKDGRTSKLPFQTLPFSMIYDCVHASGRMINQDCFVHRYFFTHAHEARFVGGYFFAHLFACSHSSAHTHTHAHTAHEPTHTCVECGQVVNEF